MAHRNLWRAEKTEFHHWWIPMCWFSSQWSPLKLGQLFSQFTASLFLLSFVKDGLMVETERISAGRAPVAPLEASSEQQGLNPQPPRLLCEAALYECRSQSVIILTFPRQNWWELLDNVLVGCREVMSLSLFSSNAAGCDVIKLWKAHFGLFES